MSGSPLVTAAACRSSASASKLGLITALLDAMDAWFQAHIARVLDGAGGMRAVELRMEAHLASVERDATSTAALYSIYTESLFAMR